MPGHLRSRLRRAFTGEEGHGPLSKIKSKTAKATQPESDYYQPGEKMPPLKYRRPVAPEHKAKLEAFSFSNAWRRRSHHSLYSPMGSRMPSRKSSFKSRRSRSRSIHRSRRSSFNSVNSVHSVHSDYDDEEWVDSGIGTSIAGDERPAKIKEASDDEGDVLNVGLSRNPTQDPRDSRRQESTGHRRSSSVRRASSRPGTSSDRTSRQPSQPFSPEDLESALQKSNLEATKEESIQSESTKSVGTTSVEEYEYPSPFLRPRGGSIYVPYDGQGTPPKLPFWGNAYPEGAEVNRDQFRRPSIFVPNEDSDSAPSERRPSVFVPNMESCSENVQRQPQSQPSPNPVTPEVPKRKPIPCCPSDEIAKILARKDLA